MDDSDQRESVVTKRKEILEFVGKERRKREYVQRLEEMLKKLQADLSSERDRVEQVNRKLENEMHRADKEEEAKHQEKRERERAQDSTIRRYLESALYEKRDRYKLETVKVSFVKNEADRKRYNLIYRVDDFTQVNQLRLDCCNYWGVPEESFILMNAANMKVSDDLRVKDSFRQGEVAQLRLARKRRMNTIVSEAELKDIQPKRPIGGKRMIDPRRDASKGAGSGMEVFTAGYDEDQRQLPGFRAALRLREPRPSEHVNAIRCCDILLYLVLMALTIFCLLARLPSGKAFWALEGFRSTLVEPSASLDHIGFNAIKNERDTWDWLASLADPLFDEGSMVRTYFVPMGYLRLREQSVQAPSGPNREDMVAECERRKLVMMLSPYVKCYPKLRSDTLENETRIALQALWSPEFGIGEDDLSKHGRGAQHGTELPWRFVDGEDNEANSNTKEVRGDFGVYTPAGYIVDYALNPRTPDGKAMFEKQKTAYLEELQLLQRGKWISKATRVVTVSFTVYSPHIDNWISAEFLIEFPPSGRPATQHRIRLFKPSTAETDLEIMALYVEQVRGLIILYIIFVSMRLGVAHKIQFWRPGIYYFFSIGGIADTLIVLAYLISFVTQSMFFRPAGGTLEAVRLLNNVYRRPDARYDYQGFVDYAPQATEYELLGIYDGCLLLCVCVRLVTYLRLSRRIYLLWRTIGMALLQYIYVCLLFIPSFVAYLFMAHKLYGKELTNFSSVRLTLLSLLMFVNGKIDYSGMFDAQTVWTPIFMVGFYYVISFSLIGCCVAITVNAFYTIWLTSECSVNDPLYKWDRSRWVRFFIPSIIYSIFESLHPGGGGGGSAATEDAAEE